MNRVMGGLPPMLNVRHKARDEYQIERPMAEYLIGDKDVAASRVLGLWWKHRFSLPDQSHRLGEPRTTMVRFCHDSC
jgi:hypothetical protein